jgi:hypothetical protein
MALRTELTRRYGSWLTWTPRLPETAKIGDVWIKGYEDPAAGQFIGFKYQEDAGKNDWRTIDNQWSDLRTTIETVRRYKRDAAAKVEVEVAPCWGQCPHCGRFTTIDETTKRFINHGNGEVKMCPGSRQEYTGEIVTYWQTPQGREAAARKGQEAE